jgi:hypothetical protein
VEAVGVKRGAGALGGDGDELELAIQPKVAHGKGGIRVTHETGDIGAQAEMRDQRPESLPEMTRAS